MEFPTIAAPHQRTDAMIESALAASDIGWGPDDHERLTIVLPMDFYHYDSPSPRPERQVMQAVMEYDGRCLELTATLATSTVPADFRVQRSSAERYHIEPMPVLGIQGARDVVLMLLRYYRPREVAIRSL